MTASLLAVAARDRRDRADAAHRVRRRHDEHVNPLHGPQSDLPLFVFKLIFCPTRPRSTARWTGALILVMLVLVLFVSARLVARSRHSNGSEEPDDHHALRHRCRTAPARAVGARQQPGRRSRATNVSAWFGKRKVLERCSLHMDARRVTALIGPSGCGKSTFLRILNRMHEVIPGAQIAGRVELDGADIYGGELSATQVRTRIGMVFQKPNPVPGDVDRRERARRAEALADARRPTRTRWSRSRSRAPGCGTR